MWSSKVNWFQNMEALVACDQPANPTPICRNGPALWETLLEELAVDGAVVAGGCIRDYLLGFEPKDIDIFVPVTNRQEFEEFIYSLNDSPLWSVELIEGEEYRVHDPHSIIGVAEGEALGLPVNIVARCSHIEGAWELINSFDYGILQWSFQSTDTGIVATTAALMDLANRTATLTHDGTYEQSLDRYARWLKRVTPVGGQWPLTKVDPYA